MVLADFVKAASVPTVEACLREEQLFNRVLAFGRTCGDEQRLLLLRGVLRYDQLHDAAEREAVGRELIKTYLGKQSVQLSFAASKLIAVADESGVFTPSTFEPAKADLQRFFVFDFYPRFLAEGAAPVSQKGRSSSVGVAAQQRTTVAKASVSSPEVRRAAVRKEGSAASTGSISPPDKKVVSDSPSPAMLRRSTKKAQAADNVASGSASPEVSNKRGSRLGSRAASPEKKKVSSSTSPVHSPPLSPKRTLLSVFRRKPRTVPLPAPTLVTPREITRSQRRESYTRSLEEFMDTQGGSRGMVHKTLLAIVNTEGKCDLFRKFLEVRYMDEGLTCLLSILEFELVPTAENGRIIYERYIAPDSPEEITLAAHVALEAKVAVEAGLVPSFGDVKREILASLSMVLAEFLESYKMPTVEESLADPRMLPFAQSCHAEPTVLFLRAAAAYERLASEAERETAGREMVKQFLAPGAPQEVNTVNIQGVRIDEVLATKIWPPTLFKALKDEQSKLFVFELYPRFLTTCGF
jgi:hypothetical protein